jgi:hypothetical protein
MLVQARAISKAPGEAPSKAANVAGAAPLRTGQAGARD